MIFKIKIITFDYYTSFSYLGTKEDVNMELAKKSLSLFKHYTRKTKTFDFGMVEKINQ
jgi:hypothetical protein